LSSRTAVSGRLEALVSVSSVRSSARRLLLVTAPVLAAAACFAGTAAAVPPPPAIVTGQDAGWPDVRGWGVAGQPANGWAPWGEFPLAFSPYPTYQNGVRVAVGDVNGDGRPEIVTAPGKSAFTELRVFEGTTYRRLGTVLPFRDASWWSGAFVAVGDTNGDGRAEIVDGLDAGCCTTVHVVDATSGNELSGFFPYGDRSEVGARVAAGDVNGDGKTEIVSALLGSAQVDVFGPSGGTAIRTIDAFGPERIGPVSIAAGDVSGDSRAEIVAAAPTGGGAQVKIFDVTTGKLQASVFPYGGAIVSSLEIALGDVNGDRRVDVITSAVTAAGTQVKAVDTDGHALAAFYVLDPDLVPGASLAAGDLDGDGKAEIVLGAGPTTAPWPPSANGPDQQVAVYRADGTRVGSFGAYPGLFQGGVRVALGDVDRDRFPEIITAPGPGLESEIGVFSQEWVNGRDRGMRLAHFLAFESTFLGGVSVAAGDVDGNGKAEIVAAAGPGRPGEVRVFDADGRQESSFLPFGSGYEGGLSVAAGDLNADGRPEIVVGTLTAPARVRAFDNGFPYGATIAPFSPDGPGAEVAVADLSGDGHGQILAAGSAGAHPQLALVDPLAGSVRRTFEPVQSQADGLRLAAGDLTGDGRDEVVVATAWGGDGLVRVLDSKLRVVDVFTAYRFPGWGMNVATAARIGLPIASEPRTVRLVAGKRALAMVARFRDAAGAGSRLGLRAEISWGDGTTWRGAAVSKGGGVYDVRGWKRYVRRGRYAVKVTLTDLAGRSSIARSTAIVKRPQRPRS
jgi:VCBS repeat protein/FG-GAP repeat protein